MILCVWEFQDSACSFAVWLIDDDQKYMALFGCLIDENVSQLIMVYIICVWHDYGSLFYNHLYIFLQFVFASAAWVLFFRVRLYLLVAASVHPDCLWAVMILNIIFIGKYFIYKPIICYTCVPILLFVIIPSSYLRTATSFQWYRFAQSLVLPKLSKKLIVSKGGHVVSLVWHM